MKRLYKYLLIALVVIIAGWGLSQMAANTRPNMQVVVFNQTGQPMVRIRLETEKTKKNLHFSGIDAGAELTIHFHNEGQDKSQLFLELADGSKLMSDSVPIAPGQRILHTVTQKEIDTQYDREKTDSKKNQAPSSP